MGICCCAAEIAPRPRPATGTRSIWRGEPAPACLSFGLRLVCKSCPRFETNAGTPRNASLISLRTVSERLPWQSEAMEQEAVTQFKGQLRGELIEPTDARYEEARKVYNAMISKKPRLIAFCADVADVMAAVQFGKQQDLKVSIRSGGHNAGGLGICDDGLVIDLSRIKFVHVDPAARTVRVGGGCTWGDVDHATHAFGLAVPSGIISTTGVGGLTLGGGIGHLTRQYGLTIDNLLAADVVLADGKFVVASADENSDLFWAIRGGGGNFRRGDSSVPLSRPILFKLSAPARCCGRWIKRQTS